MAFFVEKEKKMTTKNTFVVCLSPIKPQFRNEINSNKGKILNLKKVFLLLFFIVK